MIGYCRRLESHKEFVFLTDQVFLNIVTALSKTRR